MHEAQQNPYFSCPEDDGTMFDVYQLFQYYNAHFFDGQLERCTVRWTKRMKLCAGTCKYQGFGSSTISLSEPLLKFRTSDQLKQTLIHEMIHAYLFKTNPAACQTEGGHGPAFVHLMQKINALTGLNITVFHSFHNEVDFYRQHIWRCNGRCRDQAPFYGYVKRSMNRAPQPADHWFASHRRLCGGQFEKIGGPERKGSKDSREEKDGKGKNQKKARKSKKISEQKDLKKWGYGKSIQEYMVQMQKQAQKKAKKPQNPQQSSEKRTSLEKSASKTIPFSGKAKTIEQYAFELQTQSKILQPKQKNLDNQKLNQLLNKYNSK